MVRHLDLVRDLAGVTDRAFIDSENSFPMGTGIASSASAFAALTLAASAAAGSPFFAARVAALQTRVPRAWLRTDRRVHYTSP